MQLRMRAHYDERVKAVEERLQAQLEKRVEQLERNHEEQVEAVRASTRNQVC